MKNYSKYESPARHGSRSSENDIMLSLIAEKTQGNNMKTLELATSLVGGVDVATKFSHIFFLFPSQGLFGYWGWGGDLSDVMPQVK